MRLNHGHSRPLSVRFLYRNTNKKYKTYLHRQKQETETTDHIVIISSVLSLEKRLVCTVVNTQYSHLYGSQLSLRITHVRISLFYLQIVFRKQRITLNYHTYRTTQAEDIK